MGMEKFNYLPEATNDTMVAFIGEPDQWLMAALIAAGAVIIWKIIRKKK